MRLQADVESSFGCVFLFYLPHHTLSPATLHERTPTSSEPPLALSLAELLPFRVSCPPSKRVEKLLVSISCLAPVE